jgi:hypothetical protein
VNIPQNIQQHSVVVTPCVAAPWMQGTHTHTHMMPAESAALRVVYDRTSLPCTHVCSILIVHRKCDPLRTWE